MHANDVHTYEGPPCDHCVRTQFVGTCTHRPRKRPEISDAAKAALTPEAIEEALRLGREGAKELDKKLDQVFQPPSPCQDRPLTSPGGPRTGFMIFPEDWAVMYLSWLNNTPLSDSIPRWEILKRHAEQWDHCGSCVKQSGSCPKCIVEECLAGGRRMREIWETEAGKDGPGGN